MELKPDCEECLQMAIQEVEEAYLREGNGRHFLDFSNDWREKRIFPSWFLGEGKCCKCDKTIDGEKLTFMRIEPYSVSYYFHPSCFDALVLKNHVKGNIKE